MGVLPGPLWTPGEDSPGAGGTKAASHLLCRGSAAPREREVTEQPR